MNPLLVSLQGRQFECVSHRDAASVKIAEALLANSGGYEDFTPIDYERVAAVLIRYGRDNAAGTLNARAAEMRLMAPR